MAKTDLFVPPIVNCSSILNAGSALYVTKLVNCADEPLTYTITSTVAIALNGTTATLQVTTPSTVGTQVRLRAGSVLQFGAASIKLASNALITTTATPVTIEPAAAAVAINATATTWGMLQLLSPTDLPIDNQSQSVNRTDLSYGLQGSEVKTKVMMSSQIAIIARPDDRAYWDVIFPAAHSSQDIYALIVRGGDSRHAFGKVQVSNLTDPGVIEDFSKPTFQLSFQAPFAAPTLFPYLSTAEQTALNSVRNLAGLPSIV